MKVRIPQWGNRHWAAVLFGLAVLLFGAPSICGQAKLEPQPIFEQCPSLTSSAAPSETLKRNLTMLKNSEAKLRREAIEQVSKACDNQAVEPVIELLKDPEPQVRIAAIEVLGRLGAKDAVEPLLELIPDPDWRVRVALVGALSSFKTFRAKNSVLNNIANPSGVPVTEDQDMRLRCIAILTLNQLKDVQFSRKGVQFLYDFLHSDHLNIRQLAEQTLFALKETRNGQAELVGILKQHNAPDLRRWAAEWLGKLGIERGRQALEEAAANDPFPVVKQAAAEALAQLNRTAK